MPNHGVVDRRRPRDGGKEPCTHRVFVASDGAIRCGRCGCGLVTIPADDGALKLQWLPAALAPVFANAGRRAAGLGR